METARRVDPKNSIEAERPRYRLAGSAGHTIAGLHGIELTIHIFSNNGRLHELSMYVRTVHCYSSDDRGTSPPVGECSQVRCVIGVGLQYGGRGGGDAQYVNMK